MDFRGIVVVECGVSFVGIGNGMSDRNGNRDIHNLRRHWKIPGIKSQPVGCAHAHVLHDCFAACLCGVLVVLVVCCALRVVCCGLAVCVLVRTGWARPQLHLQVRPFAIYPGAHY